jgi:hypothetical protein
MSDKLVTNILLYAILSHAYDEELLLLRFRRTATRREARKIILRSNSAGKKMLKMGCGSYVSTYAASTGSAARSSLGNISPVTTCTGTQILSCKLP